MAVRGTARGAHALWVLVKPSSKAISAVARLFLQQRLELWRQRGRRVSPAGGASMAAESRGQDSTSFYTMSTGPSSRRAPICSTGITLHSQVSRCTGVITHACSCAPQALSCKVLQRSDGAPCNDNTDEPKRRSLRVLGDRRRIQPVGTLRWLVWSATTAPHE